MTQPSANIATEDFAITQNYFFFLRRFDFVFFAFEALVFLRFAMLPS